MADTVEFSVMESNQNLLYKIPGNGLIFYVKARAGAAIGLFEELDDECSYRISIANNLWTITCRKYGNTVSTKNNITNLLSQENYRRFWISISDHSLGLGINYNPMPVLNLHNIETEFIKYVTFFGRHRDTVHWKVLLPRRIAKPIPVKIDRGRVEWVAADNQLPDGSMIGGFEGECLYIIRSKHRGSLTPGKFVPSLGVGFIPWGGQAHEKNEFEVLCGFDCIWVQTKENEIPAEAVEAGYSEGDNSETLYVGRAKQDGFLIPGKVQPSHRVCYIPYEGIEHAHKEYEILIRPNTNIHGADEYFHNIERDTHYDDDRIHPDIYANRLALMQDDYPDIE